jgi:hypothetical protein
MSDRFFYVKVFDSNNQCVIYEKIPWAPFSFVSSYDMFISSIARLNTQYFNINTLKFDFLSFCKTRTWKEVKTDPKGLTRSFEFHYSDTMRKAHQFEIHLIFEDAIVLTYMNGEIQYYANIFRVESKPDAKQKRKKNEKIKAESRKKIKI